MHASGVISPRDAAGLTVFRVFFHAIVVWEVWRYFEYDRVCRYYAKPGFHFKYFGFTWIEPLPGNGMQWIFLALAATSLAAAIGFLYRLTAPLVAVLLAYIFLLDQTRYLNHFYLMVILAGLLAVMPANRFLAIDTRLRITRPSGTVGAWTYRVLQAQLVLVYLFAALAKLNTDWLAGEPIGSWMAARSDTSLLGGTLPIGQLFTHPWAGRAFAWGGLAVDLLVPVLLLCRRTRWAGVVVSALFHLLNSLVFNIGVFPWLMLGATTIFFDPSWPRRVFRLPEPDSDSRPAPRVLVWLLVLHFAVQLALPLRHWTYPGDVAGTEEGHRFSWRMKLRDKDAGGYLTVVDPATGKRSRVDISEYITPAQAEAMWPRPDMVLQLAHEVARRETDRLGQRPRVQAVVRASLNHGPTGFLIDPAADLAAKNRSLFRSDWIIPRPAENK